MSSVRRSSLLLGVWVGGWPLGGVDDHNNDTSFVAVPLLLLGQNPSHHCGGNRRASLTPFLLSSFRPIAINKSRPSSRLLCLGGFYQNTWLFKTSKVCVPLHFGLSPCASSKMQSPLTPKSLWPPDHFPLFDIHKSHPSSCPFKMIGVYQLNLQTTSPRFGFFVFLLLFRNTHSLLRSDDLLSPPPTLPDNPIIFRYVCYFGKQRSWNWDDWGRM